MLSFNIKPGTSAEELSERRKLAYALMQEGGSGAPVGHWTQGANRLAQALIGGYDLYNTEEAARREKAEASSLLGEALGIGGPQTSSAAPQRPVEPQAASGYGRTPQPSAGATANVSSAVGRLPAGMRNNNPGNIKYFKGVNYPGVTGPSQNLDQGDPQMVFDNPQNGMNAMAQLAYKKYAGGKRTAMDLIAGNMGWTPGNTAAAANVARTMGISPTDDLQLNNPARMQQFMKALTLQEHGPASKQYGDELYANAATAVGGRGAPAPAATPAVTSGPTPSASPLGVDPATARIIQKLSMNERTAPIAMKLLEAALTPKGGKQRYTASKQGILDTWTGQIAPIPGGSTGDSAEYGTSTKAFEDKDGNIQYMQFSKAGGGQAVALPEGARWRPDVEIKDTGTEFVPVSKQSGKVVGAPIAKNVAEEAEQKEVGKGIGERVIAKPATNANMRSSISGLGRLAEEARSLKELPGVESMTGVLQGSGYVPTLRQSTADAEAKLNTLKSQIAFNVLQAMRDASKTGGALGSVAVEELRMLQNNLASLETQQGTPAFKANLDRVVEYAEGAVNRLRAAYKDTYGQEFEDAPAQDPNQPTPVKTLRYNRDTGKFE